MKDDDKDSSNSVPESLTHRDEEPSHEAENDARQQRCAWCYRCCCGCCCSCGQIQFLPYGLLRWSLATVSAVIALAITVLAAGTCYFIESEMNDGTTFNIGINRYKDQDGSCEWYRDGVDKDVVYQSVYWDIVRYFVDIGIIVMFVITLVIASTGIIEYKCAGRTFFAKLAVGIAAMNTLYMASFLVFASDICTDNALSKCFLDDGAFLMMGSIVSWWITGWLVLHMIPLHDIETDHHRDTHPMHSAPSRFRNLYMEICGATIAAAAAVNGAIIAAERRN